MIPEYHDNRDWMHVSSNAPIHFLVREPEKDNDEWRAERYRIHTCFGNDRFHTSRVTIPYGSRVIGRYSVLPYYREVEHDVSLRASKLINSWAEHRIVADITQWYPLLHDLTPATYTEWGSLTQGPWIVKGRTNSRKFKWNTHMFAENREQLLATVSRLLDDAFIGEQGLVVRDYVQLRTLGTGINDMPISNEWRYFILNGHVLADGFYWHEREHLAVKPNEQAASLIQEVIARIQVPFFVVDIAQKEDGNWIVMELNDAQMSGLSTITPKYFYNELALSERLREYLT